MAKEIKERRIALEILMEMGKSDLHKTAMVKQALNKYDYLDAKQKSFIKYLAEGTLEREITLDYVIGQFSKTPVRKIAKTILYIVRMGVFQILYMDQVPDSAAVNEAVKLAQAYHFIGLKGFVNGILRNISRNKDNIQWPDPGESDDAKAEYLSVKFSEPLWLAKMWLSEYGLQKTVEVFGFFLKPRPVTIRFAKRMTTEEIRKILTEMKANNSRIGMKASPILPYAMDLYHTDNIRYLPGYDEGAFTVQDVSSMLVTEIAGVQKGDMVVDVCAAPGGKSMHVADVLKGTGKVIARDISNNKCMLIRENIMRMQLHNVEVQEWNAEVHDSNMENKADVLYCDLPCSGLGVIGRKPDIKYSTTPDAISDLQKIQRSILENVWNYVKLGGTLIYSTCTMTREENEENRKWILENLPFEAVGFKDRLPEKLKVLESSEDGYIQLVPGEFMTDGFFISKFRRIG